MKTGTPPKLSNSTRIYITEPTQLTVLIECYNQTVIDYTAPNQTQFKIIIVVSALMNGLLLFYFFSYL
ncbi:L-alanyl-D-glutamate peptidase [Labeo rohita]|uniref:L-alanyl-D-glutamate peptidase n=1 Tax=Labeo rohita TaxID=84645 RepID=A0ABQ8L0G2_LABRO|nr:L-alanyl-D-glutamate peptidase [Labeo rohita]